MDTAITRQAVYQFGPFRLDEAERLLLCDDKPVALTPKAFDLLVYLAARPGHLVAKDTLIAALWPDTIVEEANLASTMSALRKALGDDGQQYIATVPTRGYRFVAPVQFQTTPPQPLRANDSGTAARRTRTIVAFVVWSIVMLAVGWLVARGLNHTASAALSVQIGIAPAEGIRGPEILLEHEVGRNRPSRTSIALSPDGRHLVFAGVRGKTYQLWLRSLDGDEAVPIAGTEDGAAPFFSPDGRWIGFWAKRALWKVPLAGGAAVKICDALSAFGASWGDDDRIVLADANSGGLARVPAAGGAPEPLTRPNVANGEGSYRLPFVLPGAKAVLFTVMAVPGDPRLGTHVAVRALATAEQTLLIRNAADARYVPSGHLLYLANGTLTTAPFDLQTLRITGAPTGIAEKVMQADYGGNQGLITMAGQFTASQVGSLAWIPAAVDPNPELFRTLVWVDRNGNSSPIGAVPDAYYAPRISADGQRIVVQTVESGLGIWIYDTRRGIRTRLPLGGLSGGWPQWTPDSKRIAFGGASAGRLNLFWMPIDGTDRAERLSSDERLQIPAMWTPDGRTVIFVQCPPAPSNCDIYELSLDRKGDKPRPIVQTPADDMFPRLSPDGRWLAYVSFKSGRDEVYVQSFPAAGAIYQVSSGGGRGPMWSPDGRTIYYYSFVPSSVASPNVYFAVDISTKGGFAASAPRHAFDDPERKYVTTTPLPSYDVAPDGRFLMIEVKRGPGVVPPPPSDVRLLLNWTSRLR